MILTADAAKRDAEIKLILGCVPEETAVIQRFVADVLRIGGLLVEKP